MRKQLVIWAASFGASGVMLGALGAHALKEVLETQSLLSFETGVRYQIIHALLLLVLGFQKVIDTRFISKLIVVGVFCFSGSIYLLSIRNLIGMENLSMLGPVTPIGGLLLISSWFLILRAAIISKESK